MVGMRALVLDSYGPPPRFGLRDIPSPPLKPGCVRLRVHAVGFGFPDALMFAADALDLINGRRSTGKVVIRVAGK